MVHKNQNIEIVVSSVKPETPGHWTIYFIRPNGFEYEAGDWIDIEFPGKQLSGGKTYSLSSSPTEDLLAITFKEGLSEKKLAFLTLRPGDVLIVSQYGNDHGFQLHKNRSSVLIAGGVGIAPFRSMLAQLQDLKSTNEVHLIYLNKNSDYLFLSELEVWKHQLSNVRITYVQTSEFNRKKRDKLLLSSIGNTSQKFYIAGPPAMVQSTHDLLEGNSVEGRNIKLDSFGGY